MVGHADAPGDAEGPLGRRHPPSPAGEVKHQLQQVVPGQVEGDLDRGEVVQAVVVQILHQYEGQHGEDGQQGPPRPGQLPLRERELGPAEAEPSASWRLYGIGHGCLRRLYGNFT